MTGIKNLKSLKKNQLIRIIRAFEKAIKLNCYDCMGGQKKIDCQLRKCPLYHFRPWAKNRSLRDFFDLPNQENKKSFSRRKK